MYRHPTFSGVLIAASLSLAAVLPANPIYAAQFGLSGSDADGYFAVVGLNQEGNTALTDIIRDPNDPKFFDYPAYVNPNNTNNIYIMYVEPYMFGLAYPDPLHPTGPGTFASVGTIQPASQAGQPGVTFIEAVSEDSDFSLFDIGSITFDTSLVTGSGTEVVDPTQIAFGLDGTDFQSTNRTQLNAADAGPFGPDGRSNRNEAANTVLLTTGNLTGTGLTFTDGLLTSIDLDADVTVTAAPPNTTTPNPLSSFAVTGSLTFADDSFVFDVDGQDSSFVANDVRLLLNRSGTIDAVGSYMIPEPTSAALLLLAGGGLMMARRRAKRV